MNEKTNLVEKILVELAGKVCMPKCAQVLLDSVDEGMEGPYLVCPKCAKLVENAILKIKQVKDNG